MRISDWSSDVCSSDLDIIWRFSHHQLGVIADRFDSPDAKLGFDGYDRRFVEHDAPPAQIYDSIRRSKIDRHVLRRQLKISGDKHDLTISLQVTAMPRQLCRSMHTPIRLAFPQPACTWRLPPRTAPLVSSYTVELT